MNIVMSGVDHRIAGVEGRECYALSQAQQAELLARAGKTPGVLGAVVLATCNRTEIYLSLEQDASSDPFSLLGADGRAHESHAGDDCFYHLASVASGALSGIFAEDQILAQVKSALVFAREHRSLDSALEVFFREAIAAAKRVKTELRLSHGDNSVASAARELLEQYGEPGKALVIGNGEIGRLTAATLCQAGWRVTMTLRQYRHGEAVIPSGVEVVPYEERYGRLAGFDAVVSATASPHCTIEAEKLKDVSPLPRVFLDLAMPRDIDPAVGLLPGVKLYNIDEVSDRAACAAARREADGRMKPIFESALLELRRWEEGRAQPAQEPTRAHFPLFVSCTGKKALVVGGGKIASRRVHTLAPYTFEITVVAPEAGEEIRRLAAEGRLVWLQKPYEPSDLDGAFLAVAATGSREVNHEVAWQARHRGVFASIADCREECTFYFPAVAEHGRVTVGICGDGSAHHDVSAAARKIREALE
jgi:glutamyl-tRNA reductase